MGINYCPKKEEEFKADVYPDVTLLFRNIRYRLSVYTAVRSRLCTDLHVHACTCRYIELYEIKTVLTYK